MYPFSSNSLNWIKSYLTDRKQCVFGNKLKSSFQDVRAGVPQGSVLGPILFLLFVNDLPLFIDETYLELYADDTTVHYACKNKIVLRNKLQKGSNGFLNWCLSNNMHVHLQKTSIMWIGTWLNLSHMESLDIYLENEIIKQVDTQKLLGIIIDKSLNWDEQISAVCLNITRRISLLKQLSKYVNIDSLKLYYNSYILPILDYGCIIWSWTTIKNIGRILKLQKRAARIILKVDYMTPSLEMFKTLQWLSFPQRIKYHTALMIFKTLNRHAPEYLLDLFTKASEMHGRNLRSVTNDDLRVPFARTNYFSKSFSIEGAKQWNSLPTDIKQIKTLHSFKTSLRSHLFNSDS